ncbi:MAG: hypothetical protein AAF902_13305 [Chloroflexota bacterium]
MNDETESSESPPNSSILLADEQHEQEIVIDALEAVEVVGTISPLVILVGVGLALIFFLSLTGILLVLFLSGTIGGTFQPLRTEPLQVTFDSSAESYWKIEEETELQPDQEPLVLRASAFADGQYRLMSNVPNELFWTTAGVMLGPGVYEVDVMFNQSETGSGAGLTLLMHEEGENDQFLLYQIDPDGFVWIGLCQSGCEIVMPLTGGGWYAVEAIDQSRGGTNRLKVFVKESELVAYVNDVEVGYVFDWRISGVGDVGLLVESGEVGNVSADFDNFSWQPHNTSAVGAP